MSEAGAIWEEGSSPSGTIDSLARSTVPAAREGAAGDGLGIEGARLAIVSEQASEHGGTERVIDAIVSRHPGASVLAPCFVDEAGRGLRGDRARQVTEIWRANRCHHYLFPLYARRMRRVELGRAKVVLSMTSHGWSTGVNVPAGARHVVYYAGPSGALYTRVPYYLRAHPWPLRPLARAGLPALRRYYQRGLRRADRVIANSSWAAAEFGSEHGYRPEVIHPPVRTHFFTPAARERDQLLFVGRQVEHKRLGDLIEAFGSLKQRLVVVGEGPLLATLRRSAPPNVRLTGSVDDHELRELYRSSRALIHPSVEEFGIAMAEAQSCGTPVIAPRAGGALEIIRDGETGLLLDKVSPASIAAAVEEIESRTFAWQACRGSAERFSERVFGERFDRLLREEFNLASS